MRWAIVRSVVILLSAIAVTHGAAASGYAQSFDTAAHSATQPAGKQVDPVVARWSRTLFWAVVLLIILLVSATAIVVFSRRFRAYLAPGRRRPTRYEDVWSMHRLPADPDDGPSSGPDGGADDVGGGPASFGAGEDSPDNPLT
ncbi:MAG: hypothetical protein JXQ75_05380 [Phycisphaerae bacterium]|nr:hypothetical protein [Phycisphaerae bacterium]